VNPIEAKPELLSPTTEQQITTPFLPPFARQPAHSCSLFRLTSPIADELVSAAHHLALHRAAFSSCLKDEALEKYDAVPR
jgi:hypothetical protein